MRKCKVGDNVECINSDGHFFITKNKIYKVKRIDAYTRYYARNNDYDRIVIINDAGWEGYYLGCRFEKSINFAKKRLLK